jgi:hypothetical protein
VHPSIVLLPSIIPSGFAASSLHPKIRGNVLPPPDNARSPARARCSRQSATLTRSLLGCRLSRPAKTAAPAGLRIPSLRACGPLPPRPRSPHFFARGRSQRRAAAAPSKYPSRSRSRGPKNSGQGETPTYLVPLFLRPISPFSVLPHPTSPPSPRRFLVVAGLISLHVEISGFR